MIPNLSKLFRQLVPHLAAILVLVLCARLALWQVERAGQKQLLVDQWASAPAGALVDFVKLEHFARASGPGQFDPQRHVLLDNQVRQNHPGVHVFTPFILENGDTVMVNRGWQPWDRRAGSLPELETPESSLIISGRVSEPPRVGFQLGSASPLDPGAWPNLMTYYDSDLISSALGASVADRVLLLDPDHPAHLSGDAWPAVNMGPERHIGYAVQWASIGTAVLLIWIFLSYRTWRRR
jgi:surfeit locus 1 family protein